LGDAENFRFAIARFTDGSADFSFSGLKSAVLRAIGERGIAPLGPGEKPESRSDLADLAAGFQRAVVTALVERTAQAVVDHKARAILVSGGVAANRELRAAFESKARDLGVPVLFPSVSLSTDNAAMIAAAGYTKLLRKELSGIELNADVELRLGETGERRSRRHI
ncbi:MAG TPA: tRNA (adenosine(37)-N6)-threonylcarbamoyltransferase complex transferase subunit TsaD, partial [Vicinamibacteria bacterium]